SGSVVVLDDGRDVEGERPEVINAAAHALPIAAAVVCFPALGAVVDDRAVRDADTRAASNVYATPESIAAVAIRPAVAAQGEVAVERGAADREGRSIRENEEDSAADRDTTAQARAAVGPRPPGTAHSLIAG